MFGNMQGTGLSLSNIDTLPIKIYFTMSKKNELYLYKFIFQYDGKQVTNAQIIREEAYHPDDLLTTDREFLVVHKEITEPGVIEIYFDLMEDANLYFAFVASPSWSLAKEYVKDWQLESNNTPGSL
jgi:hypothetical protein